MNCGNVCSASYEANHPAILTASADSESIFMGWSGCDYVNGSACTVSLQSNKAVTANFVSAYALTVNKTGSGSGKVTSDPIWLINCGNICSQSIVSGTTVILTATADSGSTFTGWSGCDSVNGANQCVVTMNLNRTVSATFNLIPNYTLTVNKTGSGGGTVTGTGITCGSQCTASYASGATVILTATPDNDSNFTSWLGCDNPNGNTCSLTMNQDKTVTVTFTSEVSTAQTLTVNKPGDGNGTVTSSPAGITCGSQCSASYAYGTVVTLTAIVGGVSDFSGWTGCDSTNGNTCTVTMNKGKTVTATFTLVQIHVFVGKSGTGSGTVTSSPAGIDCGNQCDANFPAGTVLTLTATPDPGFVFTGWAGTCGNTTGNTCTLQLYEGGGITAVFDIDYTLTVNISGSSGIVQQTAGDIGSGGIVCPPDCSSFYVVGTVVTLTAIQIPSGHTFTGWSGCDSTDGITCIVTVDKNKTVTATF
jgi:hypothetical protein